MLFRSEHDSDTAGTLNLNGNPAPSSPYTATSLANSIVAIVFAPGAAVGGQNRNPNNSASVTSVSNYLDGANGDVANDDAFVTALASDGVTSATTCGSQPTPCAFNDTLLAISHEDLFAVVDSAVANKIGIDLKTAFLVPYAAAPASGGVGYYPFAVPFTTPSTIVNNYKGTSNTTYGLLPLTTDPSFLTWRIPAASEVLVTGTGGTGTGTLSSDCSTGNITTFICKISYKRTSGTYAPTFSLTAPLQNVGMAFMDPTQILIPSSWITVTSRITTKPTLNSKTMIATGTTAASTPGNMNLVLTGGALQSTANNTTRTATISIAWSGSTSQYTVRPTAPSTPNLDWFFNNQWYRLTY